MHCLSSKDYICKFLKHFTAIRHGATGETETAEQFWLLEEFAKGANCGDILAGVADILHEKLLGDFKRRAQQIHALRLHGRHQVAGRLLITSCGKDTAAACSLPLQ